MQKSRAVVERLAAGDAPVYAVNTGVGLLADVRVPPGDLETLQRNVVRSHAAGVGEPLGARGNASHDADPRQRAGQGFSGIRPVIAERLCDLLNRGVTPVVPSRGSVGASGDLAPLAHMALVLIGEGEAEFEGARMTGGEALRRAGIDPVTLAIERRNFAAQRHAGDAGDRVPGTRAGERLARAADVICAMSLDGLERHAARVRSADSCRSARIRASVQARRIWCGCSKAAKFAQSHITCRRVQDAYSLRCAPQVHGAVRDTLAEARRVFEIELNSVTDNPLVIGDEIISGGNFHGEPLALALDYLAIALTALAGISERRIDRLVNPALNEDLPAFLAGHPGLESGFMMIQVTAAALVAENRVLATPASPGSITTSGNKEDFVSMGMTSAMKLKQVVTNTRAVLAIEALTAARALDLAGAAEIGQRSREGSRGIAVGVSGLGRRSGAVG